ncbi:MULTISPECIES: antA/AntB antirepressor family protein [unclassified Sphingobacterium]|uniref:antA/AntB antirepressor family protein n=1 Tax=unclassified Sphingobacterium TaxID=2609468 RepID=UPI0025E0FE0B|nr:MULTISPECIES: antA/AntB antirepressor family protein [unclassified Sphingobacterium]
MELIKVTENNGQSVVSARDLHAFLGSKQDFSTWIKNRIKKYGFIENEDYSTLHNFVERGDSNLKSKSIEYALTLNAAKELAMVEANDKGRQARKYFIECERMAKQAAALPMLLQHMEQERLQLTAQRDEINAKLAKITNATKYINGKTEEEEWRNHFIEDYGETTLTFFEENMRDWLAKSSIKTQDFKNQYKRYNGSLGAKILYRSLREYCNENDVFLDLCRTVRIGNKICRSHIFKSKIK